MSYNSPLNHILPQEISNEIEDMACRKRVNGTKTSNELILLFKLNETATDVNDALMLQWLFKCLDTISDEVPDGHQYKWNIISQIKDSDYKDDGYIRNTIVVAIHISGDSWMSFDNDGLTIPYTYTQSPSSLLLPQDIMDCLVQEPTFISEIGVSAVSSEVMMEWWEEMISTEPASFDIAGKGYMVHPMWIKYTEATIVTPSLAWGTWRSVREQSYRFGWNGYKLLD